MHLFRRTFALLVIFALAMGFAPPANAYPRPGRNIKMHGSGWPASRAPVSVSANGRYVAFLGDWGFGCCALAIYDRVLGTTNDVASTNFGGAISITDDGRTYAWGIQEPATANVYVWNSTPAYGPLGPQKLSVAPDGSDASCDWSGCVKSSWEPSLSADGRYVAFFSFASNLVAGDTNKTADVFVRDRLTQTTERISVGPGGVEGNGISVQPQISADGGYVAYMSEASTLVAGDANGARDVFVYDRQTDTTELISAGTEPSTNSQAPSISRDGRYVAFWSALSTLVPSDTNRVSDIFIRDRQTGTTQRVTLTSDGLEGACPQGQVSCTTAPYLSPNGRFVAFGTWMSLVTEDTNNTGDVYVHDRLTGITERASVAVDSGGNGNSTTEPDAEQPPAISDDGRIVAFDSFASNLTADPDSNGSFYGDAYVHDRGPAVGVGELLAGAQQGSQLPLAGWATFSGQVLAEADDPATDVPATGSAGAELTHAAVILRAERKELHIVWRLADLPPVTGGAPGVVYGLTFTLAGQRYEVRAVRASAGPPPQTAKIALYICGVVCTEQAALSGSFGTSGDEVRATLPLATLGAAPGEVLTAVRAFTASGESATGGATIDDVALSDATLWASTVSLGIAPAGTAEDQVPFSTPAALTDSAFTGNIDISALTGGSYRAFARACLGSDCSATSVPVSIAGRAPAAPIILSPSVGAVLNHTSVTVGGTADGTIVILREGGSAIGGANTDGGSWSITTSFPEGAHTITATTSNDAGESALSSPRTFTIDTTPPTTSISSGPQGTVSVQDAAFAFSANEAATFACSLDGGAFIGCSSPMSFSSLTDGAHTFGVQATDTAGNVSDVVTRTWTIDSSAPLVAIDSGPSGALNSRSASFSFSSPDAASFSCSLDGAAFGTCTSPVAYSGLADGSHTFSVRAADANGNTSTPVSRTWTIDLAAPVVNITSGPTGTTGSTGASFSFAAGEPATFTCALDGASFTACTSPTTYTGLTMGAHTFAVQGTDAAGNASNIASRTWSIDTTLPTVSITSGPSGTVSTSSASFTFTASKSPVTFACSRDNGAFTSCTSPVSYSNLVNGAHIFAVRATDTLGNTSAPASRSWTVSVSAPPAPAIDDPTEGAVLAAARIRIGGTSVPGAQIRIRENTSVVGQTVADGSGAWYWWLTFGDGAHTITVQALDQANNFSPLTSRSFRIDTVAPATPQITSPYEGATFSTSTPRLSGNAEQGSVIAVKEGNTIIASTITDGNGHWTAKPALADGAHSVSFFAADAAGNTSGLASVGFRIDTTPPAPPHIDTPAAGSLQPGATTVRGTAEPGALIDVYENGIDLLTTVTPENGAFSLDLHLPTGVHSITTTATDGAGNVSDLSAARKFNVDADPPSLTMTSADLSIFSAGADTIAGAAADNRGVIRVELRYYDASGALEATRSATCDCGAAASPITWSDHPSLLPGVHSMRAVGYDEAGNPSAAASIRFFWLTQ